MKKYILTLDEGTTSARAVLFDKEGKVISVSQHEFEQIYPKPGYVEHNPIEIYSAQYTAVTQAIINSGISLDEIVAVGITNQRETVIVWDKSTGMPIYNAIVWQCRRTADYCEKIKGAEYEEYILKTTGLKVDAYFSATKIHWILDNIKGARERAQRGELLFGTVDTWLMWKLSSGRIYATDITNASRTMLFDIHNMCWDKKLLDIFDIPECMLPVVKASGSIFGYADILGEKIPICGVAGDQQAALFGQRCHECGDIKNTYGTGCFLLINTGSKAVFSKNGLITTVAATLENESYQYALEGSVFIGGAIIQWLRDELGLIKTAAESEEYALKAESNEGVYIVPAFAGLGAPYWNMYARGTICGLTRGSGKNQIIRAALEAIAYQTDDLIKAMQNDSEITVKALKADGGASANRFLMQFQSDISGIDVIVPESIEATAFGAACLAGLTCGFFKDKKSIPENKNAYTHFSPKTDFKARQKLLSGWHRAVKSALIFNEEE